MTNMQKFIIRWGALWLAGAAALYVFGAFTAWEMAPVAWGEKMRGFVAGAFVVLTLMVSVFAAASAEYGDE